MDNILIHFGLLRSPDVRPDEDPIGSKHCQSIVNKALVPYCKLLTCAGPLLLVLTLKIHNIVCKEKKMYTDHIFVMHFCKLLIIFISQSQDKFTFFK